MNLLYAIILGLVEGVSEWLPISSKTQTQVDIALHVVWPTGHLDRDSNRGCSRDRRNILFAKVREDKQDLRYRFCSGSDRASCRNNRYSIRSSILARPILNQDRCERFPEEAKTRWAFC